MYEWAFFRCCLDILGLEDLLRSIGFASFVSWTCLIALDSSSLILNAAWSSYRYWVVHCSLFLIRWYSCSDCLRIEWPSSYFWYLKMEHVIKFHIGSQPCLLWLFTPLYFCIQLFSYHWSTSWVWWLIYHCSYLSSVEISLTFQISKNCLPIPHLNCRLQLVVYF